MPDAVVAPSPLTPWRFHWACVNLPLSGDAYKLESVKRSPFVSDATLQLELYEKFYEWAGLCGKPVGSAVSAHFARKPYDYGARDTPRFPNNAVDRYLIPARFMSAMRDDPTLFHVDLKQEAARLAMGDAIGRHMAALEHQAMLIDNLYHPGVFRDWITWAQSLEIVEAAVSRYFPSYLYLNVAGHPSDFSDEEIRNTSQMCAGMVWETFWHPVVLKNRQWVQNHVARVTTAIEHGMDMVACPTSSVPAEQIARGIALFFPELNGRDHPDHGKVRIAAEHYGPWPVWPSALEKFGPAGALVWSDASVHREFPSTNQRITLQFGTGLFTLR